MLKIEIATRGIQFAEKPDEILQRAAETVDRPGRDDVDLAGDCRLQQAIEFRSLVAPLGAADAAIGKHVDDVPSLGLARRAQHLLLIVDRLLAVDTRR